MPIRFASTLQDWGAGGARLRQICLAVREWITASIQGMKWTVAHAGNAARTAALCTNWPECAISWHSGQFEGSSLIGYLSRDVIAVALVPIVEATLPFTTLASETV